VSASAPERVLPSDDDPFLKSGVAGLGGRPGAHARLGERRFWTPVRWLVLLTLVTSLLGFAQKSPCRTHPWVEEYQYTRGCYTDVFALYFAERLSDGQMPYTQYPVEYPVVIGGVMAVVAQAVEVVPADQRARRFYDLTWLLLTACAVVVTVATSRLAGRRRVWDAAMFAVAPGLLLHGSTNWDLVAGALAMLGLLAWARRRPVLAGVLLGVATATKLYPVLFLIPLLALCWRARKLGAWLQAAVALAVTAALVVLPVYLISPSFAEIDGQQVRVADSPLDRFGADGLSALSPHVTVPDPTEPGRTVEGTNSVYRFVQLNRTRGADWDSLYFAVGRLRVADPDSTLDRARNGVIGLVLDENQPPGEAPSVLNRAVAVSFVLTLIALGVLALKAPRRPRVAQLLFLTLVAFSLTNKVFSPQFVIWLLPLAVLARPRWRPFLAWQATEALVLLTRFAFFISNDKPGQGIDVTFFLFAILLRDLALVLYSALVVRDILRPERDVVRRDGVDDPAGGVLDGAPDRPGGGAGGVSLTKAREPVRQPA
jgi:uncharacterized membrane protein